MNSRKILKTVGLVALAAGAAAAVGVLVVRDQFSRHRRDLFSARPLRRMAALGYMAGREPSVEAVQVLRDYIAWEPRPLIRRRAVQILERMERDLEKTSPRGPHGPVASGELAG
ncbi:MAG: hypothetical protein P8Z36_02315 [Gemmatimonadota bacterium]|jgi:hypothetical protein